MASCVNIHTCTHACKYSNQGVELEKGWLDHVHWTTQRWRCLYETMQRWGRSKGGTHTCTDTCTHCYQLSFWIKIRFISITLSNRLLPGKIQVVFNIFSAELKLLSNCFLNSGSMKADRTEFTLYIRVVHAHNGAIQPNLIQSCLVVQVSKRLTSERKQWFRLENTVGKYKTLNYMNSDKFYFTNC